MLKREYKSRAVSVRDHIFLERNLKLVEKFYALCHKLKIKPKVFILVYCVDGPYSLLAWIKNPKRDEVQRAKLKEMIEKLKVHYIQQHDYLDKKEKMRRITTKKSKGQLRIEFRFAMSRRVKALKKKLGWTKNLGQVLDFPARKILRTPNARKQAIHRILNGTMNFKDAYLLEELERWIESLEKEKRLYGHE